MPAARNFAPAGDSADDAERHAGVVERHLAKFAFREQLAIRWTAAA